MCGITGILHFSSLPDADNRVRQMTNAMSHRGPDAEGFYNDDCISLGHRRLSIIDLSDAANQPFIDTTGNFVLVFNGEIYNYLQIKHELSDYNFTTTSDTEVLLAAFCKWGIDCVRKMEGMFAFALWDKNAETLWLARDRMGVKPLYFFHQDNIFAFSSENRSLLFSDLISRKIDHQSLFEYLSYQSTGYPNTIVENIHELKAGTYFKLTQTSTEHIAYWKMTSTQPIGSVDPVTVRKTIFDKLQSAVSKRMISDVPMGAFLSGGIDSSAVVALMSLNSNTKINTFNLAFSEKEYDESGYAEIIARRYGTYHAKYLLRPEDFLSQVESGLDAMDSPSADGINTYVLSSAIRKAGLKVALTGIGGDELFAGYPGFMQYYNLNKLYGSYKMTGPIRKIAANALTFSKSNKMMRIASMLRLGDASIDEVYPIIRQILSPSYIQKFIYSDFKSSSLKSQLKRSKYEMNKFGFFSQFSMAEYMGYTQHTLLKDADQMSMAVGLEIREPFFDHDLIEYVLALPDSIKYPLYPKQLLVEALSPLLPDEIVHRKKQGFVLPWEHWMRNELFTFCDSQIKNLSQLEFVKEDALLQYWSRFIKKDPSVRWMELWQFVVLGRWLERNRIV
jgi:asparagine synthase (glutamine-hydrolysing)